MDLAGSERARSTGAEGIRLKEGGHINKSLLALSTVISKLADESDGHISYRDSKLTRILQPSLGGNSRTAIICTITPDDEFYEETVGTLKFGSRAKTIKNRPVVNEHVSTETLLKRSKIEIENLKKQIEQLKSSDANQTVSMEERLHNIQDCILSSDSFAVANPSRRATWIPGTGQKGVSLLDSKELEDLHCEKKAKLSREVKMEILHDDILMLMHEINAVQEWLSTMNLNSELTLNELKIAVSAAIDKMTSSRQFLENELDATSKAYKDQVKILQAVKGFNLRALMTRRFL